MNKFSEVLQEFSNRSDLNAPQIASFCDLDRVTVFRFLKGKTLPRDRRTVHKLAEALQLTSDETLELEEAYDICSLGQYTYLQRKYIYSFMESFAGKAQEMPALQFDIENMDYSTRGTQVLAGRNAVLKQIQAEILHECAQAQVPSIDLIMYIGANEVMDILYYAGMKYKSLRLRHLIPVINYSGSNASDGNGSRRGGGGNDFSGRSAGRETYENQRNKNELFRNFLKVVTLSYVGFDYVPCYYYSRQGEVGHFPEFTNLIITGTSVLLFTDDLGSGILMREENTLNQFRREFEKFAEGKPKLVSFYDDSLRFMQDISRTFSSERTIKEEYFYTAVPCMLPLVSEEMIRKHILPEALMNSEAAINSVLEYVSSLRKLYDNVDLDFKIFTTQAGIEYFLRTGRFAEVPLEIYSPLTEEERRELLLKMANHPNMEVNIFKKALSDPEGMLSVETPENTIFIEFNIEGKGTCYLLVQEPGMVLAFREFFRGIPEEKYYKGEESREILQRYAESY